MALVRLPGRSSSLHEARRSRSPLRLKTSRAVEGPTQRELDDFRDRYPIDSRAYGVLTSVPGDVQKSVLNQFRPKREGESDYSALVASFVRAVMHRHTQTQLQPRGSQQSVRPSRQASQVPPTAWRTSGNVAGRIRRVC